MAHAGLILPEEADRRTTFVGPEGRHTRADGDTLLADAYNALRREYERLKDARAREAEALQSATEMDPEARQQLDLLRDLESQQPNIAEGIRQIRSAVCSASARLFPASSSEHGIQSPAAAGQGAGSVEAELAELVKVKDGMLMMLSAVAQDMHYAEEAAERRGREEGLQTERSQRTAAEGEARRAAAERDSLSRARDQLQGLIEQERRSADERCQQLQAEAAAAAAETEAARERCQAARAGLDRTAAAAELRGAHSLQQQRALAEEEQGRIDCEVQAYIEGFGRLAAVANASRGALGRVAAELQQAEAAQAAEATPVSAPAVSVQPPPRGKLGAAGRSHMGPGRQSTGHGRPRGQRAAGVSPPARRGSSSGAAGTPDPGSRDASQQVAKLRASGSLNQRRASGSVEPFQRGHSIGHADRHAATVSPTRQPLTVGGRRRPAAAARRPTTARRRSGDAR
eukprot:TRINITY_DN51740_c0_g1_i1.p1 TRINITY_DN51740_c0_g1~~TRINITY_DN51740_c0_g1_i1.p1  ORF type:complete len:482 (+),score=119.34 TRINITY_DN51740_c0_g1_i1:73-1446(+)